MRGISDDVQHFAYLGEMRGGLALWARPPWRGGVAIQAESALGRGEGRGERGVHVDVEGVTGEVLEGVEGGGCWNDTWVCCGLQLMALVGTSPLELRFP